MMSRRKRLLILLDIVFLALIGLFVFAGRDAVPLHGDETTFTWLSLDYDRLFLWGEASSVPFQQRPPDLDAQWQRVMVGAINPLTIGLARSLAGIDASQVNTSWDWNIVSSPGPWEWTLNQRAGNLPSERLLAVSRTPSTLFTILSVIALYGIARGLSGSRLAAWVASLLYITDPAILINGRRAMQEGAMLFFTALTVLIALRAVQAQARPGVTRNRVYAWYIALGAAGGAAIAAKHTAAIVTAAAFAAVLFAPLLTRWITTAPSFRFNRQHVLAVLSAGTFAYMVAIILMPVWWSWPRVLGLAALAALLMAFAVEWRSRARWIARGGAGLALLLVSILQPILWAELVDLPYFIFQQRNRLMAMQGAALGELSTPGERLIALADQAFFAETQYYEAPAWSTFDTITAQIQAYDGTLLKGRSGALWGLLEIGLLLGGVAALIQRRRAGEALLMSLWLLFIVLALLMNKLPIQRYYIILQAPLAVLAGVGAAWLAYRIRTRPQLKMDSLPGLRMDEI